MNDPADCAIKEIDDSQLDEHARTIKQVQIEGFYAARGVAQQQGQPFLGQPSAVVKRLFRSIERKVSLDDKYEIILGFQKECNLPSFSNPYWLKKGVYDTLSKVGVFSMSEAPDEYLLWSHYADGHKGIAIGYGQTDGSILDNPSKFGKITYTTAPRVFDVSKGVQSKLQVFLDGSSGLRFENVITPLDPQIRTALFTKTRRWEYEAEWRYVETTHGLHPRPGPITELIFGAKCSQQDRQRIRSLCEKGIPNSILYREASVDPTTDQVVISDLGQMT